MRWLNIFKRVCLSCIPALGRLRTSCALGKFAHLGNKGQVCPLRLSKKWFYIKKSHRLTRINTDFVENLRLSVFICNKATTSMWLLALPTSCRLGVYPWFNFVFNLLFIQPHPLTLFSRRADE
jgi:hypothetical protein